jgi:hypothetical protein
VGCRSGRRGRCPRAAVRGRRGPHSAYLRDLLFQPRAIPRGCGSPQGRATTTRDVGETRFVVDTSRNGNGAKDVEGEDVNCRTSTDRCPDVPSSVGVDGADYLPWIKVLGDSNRSCSIGERIPAGSFSPYLAEQSVDEAETTVVSRSVVWRCGAHNSAGQRGSADSWEASWRTAYSGTAAETTWSTQLRHPAGRHRDHVIARSHSQQVAGALTRWRSVEPLNLCRVTAIRPFRRGTGWLQQAWY